MVTCSKLSLQKVHTISHRIERKDSTTLFAAYGISLPKVNTLHMTKQVSRRRRIGKR